MTGGEDLALLVGRVLLALMFVVSAVDKFRLNQTETQQIASLNLPAPAFFLRLTGLFELLGVVSLIFGIYARVFAAALALFVGVVSLLFVNFWSFRGPTEARTMMRNVFFGNTAVMGGLLYVAVLGSGTYSVVDI